MMGNFQDVAQGCFDQYMGDNPDAAPMDAFDAVGAGIDHQMADMDPNMSCSDMAGDMPPPPPPGEFGQFMDECPPCGSFPGGENYDAGAHPHEGGMADMMGPPPGDMAGPPPGEGGPPPGDMAGGPDMPPPGDMGPGPDGPPPGDMGPGPDGPMGPLPGDMGPDQTDQWDHLQVIWDQVVPIHYLDQVILHLLVDQMDHLQELTWTVTECLHLLQVIWDPDQTDQWDLRWMIWVEMHSHMDEVLIINQDLRDQKDLLQELIWMATEWLRLLHLTIQAMM